MEEGQFQLKVQQCIPPTDRRRTGDGQPLIGQHVTLSHRGQHQVMDQKLCQAKFAHNHAVNRGTGFNPLQIVYATILRGPLNLLPLLEHTKVSNSLTI